MGVAAAFVLGLLMGWLIEWVIDWFYWRKNAAFYKTEFGHCEEELAQLKNEKKDLQKQIDVLKMELASHKKSDTGEQIAAPDDLELIKGIGPKIAGMLNDSGIYSFEQLAGLTPEGLRGIVGDLIQRLADEENIIEQARQLAKGHSKGA